MKLTIARKLTFGFGFLVLLLVIIAVFSARSLNISERLTAELIEYQQIVQVANLCKEELMIGRVGVVQSYLTGTGGGLRRLDSSRKNYDKWWLEVKGFGGISNPEMITQVEEAKVEYDRRLDLAVVAIEANPDALDRADPDVIDVINANLDFAEGYASSVMFPLLESLYEQELRDLEDRAEVAQQRSNVMTTLAYIFGAVSVIVGAAAAFFISRGITRSTRELSEAADAISRGDLDVPIQIKTGDEMEVLADSIERMRNSLRAAIERLRR
jgi:HAMP domain-containing protein